MSIRSTRADVCSLESDLTEDGLALPEIDYIYEDHC